MTATVKYTEFGSIGLNGYTRAVLEVTTAAADTSADLSIPAAGAFTPIAVINTIGKAADGTPVTPALWYDSTNSKWVLKFSAAPGAGTYTIFVIGQFGRRDVSSENPQGTRP